MVRPKRRSVYVQTINDDAGFEADNEPKVELEEEVEVHQGLVDNSEVRIVFGI